MRLSTRFVLALIVAATALIALAPGTGRATMTAGAPRTRGLRPPPSRPAQNRPALRRHLHGDDVRSLAKVP